MKSLLVHIIKHVNPDSRLSRRIILWLGIVVYFVAFFSSQKFENSALLWGDEWEYQSMAVNFAKGYGLQIHGGLTNFEDYKFMAGSNDYVANFSKQHQYNFYRTPLYPLFVGMIYTVFGVNPYLAKIIQLLLLIFVGAYLPLMAYNFWGRRGFYSGIIATPIFISLNYKFAGSILTEPFLIFIIFLVIIAKEYHLFGLVSGFYSGA
jgi:hypothetical protein